MAAHSYVGLIPILCAAAFFPSAASQTGRQANGPLKRIKVIEIDESANGRDVHLRVGDELKLSLRENRSTGYRWELTQNPGSVLHLTADTFEGPAASRPGASGARHWVFKAYDAGRASIELDSKRSWETGPSSKRFQCNVLIDQPAR